MSPTGRSIIVAPSIEAYHSKSCPAARRESPGKCARKSCSYRAKHGGKWSPRFPTMAEAKEWRRSKEREGEAQRTAGPAPAITLAEAWAAWVKVVESGRLHSRSGTPYKPVTIRDYKEAMARRVLPDYGGNALADVTHKGLKTLVADLREQGASPSAIRNTINPLRALYRDADEVVEGWDRRDPTAGLRLPKVNSRRKADRIPTPEQAAALVKHAPDRDRALWATACFAGLRRGELRALRWRDVDLTAGRIHVRRSWDRVEREIAPKSDAGTREVPIFDVLRPILEAHRARHAQDTGPDGLVFATRTGGPFDPTEVTKRADRAWPKASTPVARFTLHEGRHGAASVWIEAGVNARRVQAWMGHSSITTTYDLYGKLLDRSEGEQVALVDGYLRGTFVGPSGAKSSGTERKASRRVPRAKCAVKAAQAA